MLISWFSFHEVWFAAASFCSALLLNCLSTYVFDIFVWTPQCSVEGRGCERMSRVMVNSRSWLMDRLYAKLLCFGHFTNCHVHSSCLQDHVWTYFLEKEKNSQIFSESFMTLKNSCTYTVYNRQAWPEYSQCPTVTGMEQMLEPVLFKDLQTDFVCCRMCSWLCFVRVSECTCTTVTSNIQDIRLTWREQLMRLICCFPVHRKTNSWTEICSNWRTCWTAQKLGQKGFELAHRMPGFSCMKTHSPLW